MTLAEDLARSLRIPAPPPSGPRLAPSLPELADAWLAARTAHQRTATALEQARDALLDALQSSELTRAEGDRGTAVLVPASTRSTVDPRAAAEALALAGLPVPLSVSSVRASLRVG